MKAPFPTCGGGLGLGRGVGPGPHHPAPLPQAGEGILDFHAKFKHAFETGIGKTTESLSRPSRMTVFAVGWTP